MHHFAVLQTLLTLFLVFGPVAANVEVRNLPGLSAHDTVHEIRRHLVRGILPGTQRVLFDNTTSLDSGIADQKLFEYTHTTSSESNNGKGELETKIEVTCSKCYTKGMASAKLTVQGDFNMTNAMIVAKQDFHNILHSLFQYGKDLVKNFKVSDLDQLTVEPPPHIDFDVKIPELPDTELEITFHDAEIYVAIDTELSAGLTYTFTIFRSTELGVQVTEKLFVGAIFSIDLILTVDSEITISNGFHLKLDDDVSLKIALFAKEASHLSFNGGQFEFLPVQIESSGVVFTALLRLQLRAGFSFPDSFELDLSEISDLSFGAVGGDYKIGAGIEARAYANLAKFTTNVTENVDMTVSGKPCPLHVAQEYEFAVGAAAGASLILIDQTWGPTPETEIPIFYTGFGKSCVVPATATSTVSSVPAAMEAAVKARATGDMKTTTLSTSVTYQAIACASTGLINCPASLQQLTTYVTEKTLVTVVPSGSDASWPTSTSNIDAVAFGNSAMTMTASSGKPSSYVPPPPPTSTSSGSTKATADSNGSGDSSGGGGLSKTNKIIVGVCVGLGVPLLAALAFGVWLVLRRSRGQGGEKSPQ